MIAKTMLLSTFGAFTTFASCKPTDKTSAVKSEAVKGEAVTQTPTKVECGNLEAMTQPQGKLSDCRGFSGGSNGGCWTTDGTGKEWFVKVDRTFPELQSGGEIIGARIYRALGYTVPDTAILNADSGGPDTKSRRVASLKVAGTWSDSEFGLSNISNSPSFRQLRVYAAFLKDWDRLGNPANTFVGSGGTTFAMLDFGGTLGSRAQGGFKPDEPVFSNAIGGFGLSVDGAAILDKFKMQVSPDHPWLNLKSEDWQVASAKLVQCLPDEAVDRYVDDAKYSDSKDSIHMKKAIKNRRDSLAKEAQKRSGAEASTAEKKP